MGDTETARARSSSAGSVVPIHVVATTLTGTRDALAAALLLANGAKSRVCVLARCGPARRPGMVSAAEAAHEWASAIRRLPEASSPEVDVLACVSRRPSHLAALLPPGGVVFIGGGGSRWWATPEQRLAHQLARLGRRVLFIHGGRASGAASSPLPGAVPVTAGRTTR